MFLVFSATLKEPGNFETQLYPCEMGEETPALLTSWENK
jgi:hypothetical protein